MGTEYIELAQGILLTFALLFLSGTLGAKLADYLKIPDIVVFLLLGIVLGPSVLAYLDVPAESVANNLMLIFGAAFLLFQGGSSVSFHVLKKVWLTLVLLATLAVIIMTVVIGSAAHYIFGINWLAALLLAAVLASTDPATLVPIFQVVKVRAKVAQTVLCESAFNDATGAIATFGVLGMIASGQVSWTNSLAKFGIMAGGGILTGLVFGLATAFLICDKTKHFLGAFTQALILSSVILTYLAAEHFGGSGFMAVFVLGLIYGNVEFLNWKMHEGHSSASDVFVNDCSLLFRMIIFILLGTHVDLVLIKTHLWSGIALVGAFMFIARPLAVLACTLPDRKAEWTRNEIIFMFWTRETGVIPAALSGMLVGMKVPHADLIAAMTFMAILGTLVIQASTTRWLAQKLNLMEQD